MMFFGMRYGEDLGLMGFDDGFLGICMNLWDLMVGRWGIDWIILIMLRIRRQKTVGIRWFHGN